MYRVWRATVNSGHRLPRSGYHDWQVITRYDASALANRVINNDTTRLLSDRYTGTVINFPNGTYVRAATSPHGTRMLNVALPQVKKIYW